MAQRENEKMYGFYAPPSLMEKFQAVAKAQDLNMSQLMRALARREILRVERLAAPVIIPGRASRRAQLGE